MSEQQNAAPQSGTDQSAVEQQQPEQQQEPRVYTEADIIQLRKSGDREGLAKAVEQLTRQAQGELPLPQEPDAGQTPDGQIQEGEQPQEQGQKKTFDIRFRGMEVSYDDSDGYLGAGDFGKMKKELAHNRAKLGDVEEQLSKHSGMYEGQLQKFRSLQEQKEAAEAKAKTLEARVSELEKGLQKAQESRAPKPDAPQKQAEIPEPPERPDLDEDPMMWSDEDKAAHKKYRADRSAYDKKINELLRKAVSGQLSVQQKPASESRPASPAPSQAQQLPPEVQEAVEYFKKARQGEQAQAVTAQQKAYWDSFRDFQGKHNDFKTPTDIEELNRNVLQWMDKLAYANGFDLKPGATDSEKANYDRAKRQLAYKYATGDAQVLANSEGCPAPDGYDTYVKLANLDKVRKDLINRGVLGNNAGLHETWLYHYSDSGMNDDIRNLEASAVQRGASGAISALQKNQQQYARNIPNNAAGGGAPPAPVSSQNGVSPDEIKQLLSLTPIQLAQKPELAERRRQVLQMIHEQSTPR